MARLRLPPRSKPKQFGSLWVQTMPVTNPENGVTTVYDLVWMRVRNRRGLIRFVLAGIHAPAARRGR